MSNILIYLVLLFTRALKSNELCNSPLTPLYITGAVVRISLRMEVNTIFIILSVSPFSLPAIFLAARTKKKKYLGNVFNKHYALDLFLTGLFLRKALKNFVTNVKPLLT